MTLACARNETRVVFRESRIIQKSVQFQELGDIGATGASGTVFLLFGFPTTCFGIDL